MLSLIPSSAAHRNESPEGYTFPSDPEVLTALEAEVLYNFRYVVFL